MNNFNLVMAIAVGSDTSSSPSKGVLNATDTVTAPLGSRSSSSSTYVYSAEHEPQTSSSPEASASQSSEPKVQSSSHTKRHPHSKHTTLERAQDRHQVIWNLLERALDGHVSAHNKLSGLSGDNAQAVLDLMQQVRFFTSIPSTVPLTSICTR